MADSPKPLRLLAWSLPVLALLALLLAVYAAPRWGLPWRGEVLALAPARFQGGAPEGEVLRVPWAAGATRALLVANLDTGAAPMRFLRYRLIDFPRSLRLLLGWRAAADAPWQWAPLPFPDGPVTVDLARLSPQWQGRAGSIALLLLPAELLPAEAVPAQAPALVAARLEGDGHAAAIAALLDEWRAYRPWSGRSINTAGFDLGYADQRPLQGFVALLAVLALLAGMLATRRRRRAWLPLALLVAGAAWLLLDLAHLRTLAMRAVHTSALSQSAAGELAINPPLARSLAAVRALPALRAPDSRVAVLAGSPFLRSWPLFELLPANAAPVEAAALGQVADGMLLLRLGDTGEYRRDAGVLRTDTVALRVQELYADQHLQLLRVRARDPRP